MQARHCFLTSFKRKNFCSAALMASVPCRVAHTLSKPHQSVEDSFFALTRREKWGRVIQATISTHTRCEPCGHSQSRSRHPSPFPPTNSNHRIGSLTKPMPALAPRISSMCAGEGEPFFSEEPGQDICGGHRNAFDAEGKMNQREPGLRSISTTPKAWILTHFLIHFEAF